MIWMFKMSSYTFKKDHVMFFSTKRKIWYQNMRIPIRIDCRMDWLNDKRNNFNLIDIRKKSCKNCSKMRLEIVIGHGHYECENGYITHESDYIEAYVCNDHELKEKTKDLNQ